MKIAQMKIYAPFLLVALVQPCNVKGLDNLFSAISPSMGEVMKTAAIVHLYHRFYGMWPTSHGSLRSFASDHQFALSLYDSLSFRESDSSSIEVYISSRNVVARELDSLTWGKPVVLDNFVATFLVFPSAPQSLKIKLLSARSTNDGSVIGLGPSDVSEGSFFSEDSMKQFVRY